MEGARRQCIAHHDNAGPTLSGFTSPMIGATCDDRAGPTDLFRGREHFGQDRGSVAYITARPVKLCQVLETAVME